MEGDGRFDEDTRTTEGFQSTPSAWRATLPPISWRNLPDYFNPRPSHRGRPCNDNQHTVPDNHFNPRPPHGGRPDGFDDARAEFFISIHALRMEGDSGARPSVACSAYFNPRPPHGGRLAGQQPFVQQFLFQSTPSAWRATGAKRPLVIQRFSKAFSRTSKMPSCSPQEISS